MNPNIHIFSDHAVIAHKMAILRNELTPPKEFRGQLYDIAFIMGSEAFKNLPLKKIRVKTPMMEMYAYQVENMPCIIPITRAGLSMESAMWEILPDMPSYDIGLRRDESSSVDINIVEYSNKLPEKLDANRLVVILDPMIATGKSAVVAIDKVKKTGARNIAYMGIVSCDKGLNAIMEAHPDVKIYCAAKDPELGTNNYIYPGLGDAGDRYKNT
jgi:uracil phosphoribosyltransferase